MFRTIRNHEDIFRFVDQLKVWQYIIGRYVTVGEKFCNPLRNDNHPNCYLYERNGYILLADWANRTYHGISIVKALEHKEHTDFKGVLDFLNKNNYKHVSSSPTIIPKKKKNFKFRLEFKYRNYNQDDIDYWSQYGITTDILKHEEVYPVSYYFRNSRRYPDSLVQIRAEKHAYGISINNRRKLYQPYSRDFKWLTSFTEYDIGGKTRKDTDTLIITKSFKDYLVLKYNTEYDVQFIPSESIHLNQFYIDVINDKYNKIIVLMDNDATGHKAAKRLSEQIGEKAVGTWLIEANDPAQYYKDHNNIDIIVDIVENIKHDTVYSTQVMASNNRQVLSG